MGPSTEQDQLSYCILLIYLSAEPLLVTDLLIWFIARDYFVMMNILGFGEPLWSSGSFFMEWWRFNGAMAVLYGVMEVSWSEIGFMELWRLFCEEILFLCETEI